MLETSLDDPPPLSTSMRHNRSKSMQFLETNLDDDEGSGLVAQNANSSASGGNKLSRSMQLLNGGGNLSVNSSLLLETDM